MSALLNGASLGSQIVQNGFDEYWKTKKYQELVNERAQDRATAADSARFAQFEKGVADDRAAGAESFKQNLDMATLGERKARDTAEEAHWKAMEARAGGRGLAGGVMTPAQATSAIAEIDRMTKGVITDPETWHRREGFKAIQTPSYAPRPFPGVPASGWNRVTLGLLGDPGAPAEGTKLPGLE